MRKNPAVLSMRVVSGEFGEAHSFTRLCWKNGDCTGLKKQPSPNTSRVTLAQPGRCAPAPRAGYQAARAGRRSFALAVGDVGAHRTPDLSGELTTRMLKSAWFLRMRGLPGAELTTRMFKNRVVLAHAATRARSRWSRELELRPPRSVD